MKKRKTWRSKLTKEELRHLKKDVFESGTRITLAVLEHMFKVHAEMRRENPDIESCWTCRRVAKKLGFEV